MAIFGQIVPYSEFKKNLKAYSADIKTRRKPLNLSARKHGAFVIEDLEFSKHNQDRLGGARKRHAFDDAHHHMKTTSATRAQCV